MADRGLALLDAGTLLIVIEERGELRVAASSGEGIPRVRILSVEGSALGSLYRAGQPVALDRPRGQEERIVPASYSARSHLECARVATATGGGSGSSASTRRCGS